ncbi:MAG: SdpI family protein [OCS116 cluster bacterium]|uniref:SdpI family protein n=1 Tax=OCS116 cluster bacterium TaxID=2030921 RepID=A0A2A4YVW5_9PROT|nr:SdpI family protein [OCS116 cluster bacterium]
MKNTEFKISKSQPMKVHAIAIIFMVIVSYFTYPYAIEKLGCGIELGLLNCLIEAPRIFVYTFALPGVYIAVIFVGLIVAKKDPHKEALHSNLSKLNSRYYLLAIFYCGMSTFMFLSVYLSEEFMQSHEDNFQLAISVATTIFVFLVTNIAPKMNKSLFSGFACKWNLKSELAWEKSQRFAGFAMALVCAICLVVAFTYVNLTVPLLMLGIGLNYVGVVIISRRVYKKELSQNLNH